MNKIDKIIFEGMVFDIEQAGWFVLSKSELREIFDKISCKDKEIIEDFLKQKYGKGVEKTK